MSYTSSGEAAFSSEPAATLRSAAAAARLRLQFRTEGRTRGAESEGQEFQITPITRRQQ